MSVLRKLTRAMGVLFIATPLIAQSTTTISDTTARGAPAAIASVAPSATIIERAPSGGPAPSWTNAVPAAPVQASQAAAFSPIESGSTAENKALMIVGGSGILIGAIVGGRAGTAIMVGGSLVGLVGLWNYLK